jgi:hypothetical protein
MGVDMKGLYWRSDKERAEAVRRFDELAAEFAQGEHGIDEEWLKQKMKSFATAWVAGYITPQVESEFPREREEAVRRFIEKVRAKTMEHFENDIWTSADAEVFKEMFSKEL